MTNPFCLVETSISHLLLVDPYGADCANVTITISLKKASDESLSIKVHLDIKNITITLNKQHYVSELIVHSDTILLFQATLGYYYEYEISAVVTVDSHYDTDVIVATVYEDHSFDVLTYHNYVSKMTKLSSGDQPSANLDIKLL